MSEEVSKRAMAKFLNSKQEHADMIAYYKEIASTLEDDDMSYTARFIRSISDD